MFEVGRPAAPVGVIQEIESFNNLDDLIDSFRMIQNLNFRWDDCTLLALSIQVHVQGAQVSSFCFLLALQ